MIKSPDLRIHLDSLRFSKSDRGVRLISLLSAAIAISNPDLIKAILQYMQEAKIRTRTIYETILQSYLFLGFPRTIEAILVYYEVYGSFRGKADLKEISRREVEQWFSEGTRLCRRIYGKNYERLKGKILTVSPDIFRWIIIEAYGKVLSRPGMTQRERELAGVSTLIVERRERQLVSHIMGSINVGAKFPLLHRIIEDIEPLAGARAAKMADKITNMIEKKYEIKK
ncbi:MAG: hypothetical protein NTV06_03090 [candidate division Zixibacteria bacterium]|nr:hypothetical protein [candidate division Zixibacteria bacterium]